MYTCLSSRHLVGAQAHGTSTDSICCNHYHNGVFNNHNNVLITWTVILYCNHVLASHNSSSARIVVEILLNQIMNAIMSRSVPAFALRMHLT